jgi:hypothetical protein
MKGAHAELSGTAWQEIGVKPFFGLSWIMALDLPFPVCYAPVREIKVRIGCQALRPLAA